MLGGAALVATRAEGRPTQVARDADARPAQDAEASGKVTLYGEGSSSYFALSKMPEKVERFHIQSDISDRLGCLVLAAAERGWEIEVRYTRFPDEPAGLLRRAGQGIPRRLSRTSCRLTTHSHGPGPPRAVSGNSEARTRRAGRLGLGVRGLACHGTAKVEFVEWDGKVSDYR
jgi:hypothetical protein